MNPDIKSFLHDLNTEIDFCHFKSNNNLKEALEGVGDLDLLIRMEHFDKFFEVAHRWKFRLAQDALLNNTPHVFHMYGLGQSTNVIIHLHVYFKLVTGGSLVKNYRVPLEQAFLTNREVLFDVPVPNKNYDLILFVLRKFLEQPSFLEHFLFWKDRKNIYRELLWLTEFLDLKEVELGLQKYLPVISFGLFQECLKCLQERKNFVLRILLGMKVRRLFNERVYFEKTASFRRSLIYMAAFWRARTRSEVKNRFLLPGGKVVAFVGPEASGKSTISKEVSSYFSTHFDTKHIHLGKPPKSHLTRPVWGLIAVYSLLKRLVTKVRPQAPKGSMGTGRQPGRSAENMPNPIVAVLDAIDRFEATKKCSKHALQGKMVFTDRYPSFRGEIDGPRIGNNSGWLRLLSVIEGQLYKRMPKPDLVFHVSAPIEITLKRNDQRQQPEPEEFVRKRHSLAMDLSVLNDGQHYIDTTSPLESCVSDVVNKIWVS